MRSSFDLIIVIPVGPGTKISFLRDTIDSCIHYTSATYRIVVADNSEQHLGKSLMHDYPDLDVIITDKASDPMGGLYITLSHVYTYVLSAYDFKILMKLDTDALIIGHAPEQLALNLFRAKPSMAMAGQYPFDYSGNPWDLAWPRDRILNGTTTWKFIARPYANLVLAGMYRRALKHGYTAGESVFGGAYYMSRDFIEEMHHRRVMPRAILSTVRLGEDHIFSLLAKSFGMELGDLSGNVPAFACAWKGLPASPAELYSEGRLVIHSTREWKHLNEEQIRDFFRNKREEERAGSALIKKSATADAT